VMSRHRAGASLGLQVRQTVIWMVPTGSKA
jgi:hypothetical protein